MVFLKILIPLASFITTVIIIFLKEVSKKVRIFLFILAALSLAGTVLAIFSNINENKMATASGTLESPRLVTGIADSVVLLAGSNTGVLHHVFKDTFSVYPLEYLWGISYPLTIRMTNKGLLVSIKFYDLEGHLVAELDNNQWSVNKNDAYDRNYSKYAVEVRDRYGLPVAQIELVNKSALRIGGIFFLEGATLIIGESITRMIYVRPKSSEELQEWAQQTGLKSWFKYPSKEYLGKRVT